LGITKTKTMEQITNKYGMTFKVGQLVEITRQFSDLKEQVKITKLSSRFIYAKGMKFCVNNRSKGQIGNVK
jgi:hypothetical protein